MAQSRIFTEHQFQNLIQKLYPEQFGAFSGYKCIITFIYTFGKAIAWDFLPSASPATLGAISDSWIDKEQKQLVGGGVVDIQAVITIEKLGTMSIAARPIGTSQSRNPRLTTRSPSLNNVRTRVLRVLAHEFFHLIQDWQYLDAISKQNPQRALDAKLPQKAYSAVYRDLKTRLRTQNPQWDESVVDGKAYVRHPLEKDAEQNAAFKISRFQSEIDRGLWDKYFPKADIERELQLQSSRIPR